MASAHGTQTGLLGRATPLGPASRPAPSVVRPLRRVGDPRLADLQAWIVAQDPRRHRMHVAVASVALGLQPLSTALAAAGQIAVVLVALSRVRLTWRTLPALAACPLVVALGVWIAWGAVALAWSSDVPAGLDALSKARFVAVGLALWPVLDRPWPLIAGMAAGSAVQALVQLLMYVGIVPSPVYDPWVLTGGLSKHPGNTALWAAASCCLLLGAAIARPDVRRLASALLVACLASVVLAGNRTLLAALPAALLVVVVMAVIRTRGRWHHAVLGLAGVALVAVASASLLMPDRGPIGRLSAAATELRDALVHGRTDTSGGLRVIWIRDGWALFLDSPVHGHGTGSVRNAFAAQQARTPGEDRPTRARTDNPHATLVLEAVERGSIGLLLILAVALIGVAAAWRRSREEAALVGLFGAVIVLGCYGVTASLQLSGFTMGLAATILVLSIRRPRPEPEPPPATY